MNDLGQFALPNRDLPAEAQPSASGSARLRLPAWLLSLALHLAILLLVALLVRGTSRPSPGRERARPGGIVLAPPSSQDGSRYFSADPATGPARGDERDSGALAAPWPSAADPPPALVALPQGEAAAGTSQGLLVLPLGSGKRVARSRPLSGEDVAAILAEEAARAKPAEPTGPTARLSLFGSGEAEGRSFVFLIDRSQSMGHRGLGAIAAAANELAASIDRLGPEQKFQVIAYNQKPDALGGRELLPATDENKRRLIEFVEGTIAFGATEHEMGLFAALRFRPDVIFLFTDAGDPGLKPGQLRALRQAAAGRSAIHCLHFGSGPLEGGENFLQRLAAENSGSYVYINMRP